MTESLSPLASMGEARSLKALANELLQKNTPQRKDKTTALTSIPSYDRCETNKADKLARQTDISNPCSIKDDFEERIAIAEYDGKQDAILAYRIAYEGAIMAILNANPPNDLVRPNVDWLQDRIKSAEDYLIAQGIARPS
jgi:hypothetical protein